MAPLAVQAAETALTVEDDVLLVLGVESHESLELFLDALAVGLRVLYGGQARTASSR